MHSKHTPQTVESLFAFVEQFLNQLPRYKKIVQKIKQESQPCKKLRNGKKLNGLKAQLLAVGTKEWPKEYFLKIMCNRNAKQINNLLCRFYNQLYWQRKMKKCSDHRQKSEIVAMDTSKTTHLKELFTTSQPAYGVCVCGKYVCEWVHAWFWFSSNSTSLAHTRGVTLRVGSRFWNSHAFAGRLNVDVTFEKSPKESR